MQTYTIVLRATGGLMTAVPTSDAPGAPSHAVPSSTSPAETHYVTEYVTDETEDAAREQALNVWRDVEPDLRFEVVLVREHPPILPIDVVKPDDQVTEVD